MQMSDELFFKRQKQKNKKLLKTQNCTYLCTISCCFLGTGKSTRSTSNDNQVILLRGSCKVLFVSSYTDEANEGV